jgi:hypothetical protein
MINDAKVYDTLKGIAQLGLPILGALYFALAVILGMPYATVVIGTIVVIDALLGVLLCISTMNYSSENVGRIVTTETPKGKIYALELKGDPEIIDTKNEVRFTVVGAKTPKLALAREREAR